MSQIENNKRLHSAILAAQRSIQALVKDGTNDHHKFKFASTEGTVSECRGVLHDAGVVVTRCGSSIRAGETVQKTSKNGAWSAPSAWVDVQFLVAHPDSGQAEVRTMAMYAEAENGQPLDKKILGALTSALGYFLVGLLLVPRFDEYEISARDDRKYDPNTLGSDGQVWVMGELRRINCDLGWLRQGLIRRNEGMKSILLGEPRGWPRKVVPQIQEAFRSVEPSQPRIDESDSQLPEDERHANATARR